MTPQQKAQTTSKSAPRAPRPALPTSPKPEPEKTGKAEPTKAEPTKVEPTKAEVVPGALQETIPQEPVYEDLEPEEKAVSLYSDGTLTEELPTHPNTQVLGIDDLEAEDFSLPRMLLVQGTSGMEGAEEHIGWLWNSTTAQFFRTVTCVMLQVRLQRVCFSEEAGQPPLCSSQDAKRPFSEFIGQMALGIVIPDTCEECQLKEWSMEADGITSVPPYCDLVYAYAGLDVATGMPFSISLRGAAAAEAKKLNWLIKAIGMSQPLVIAPRKVTGRRSGKSFWVPTFTATGSPTPTGVLRIAQSIVRSFSGPSAYEPVEERGVKTEAPPATTQTVETTDEDSIPF